MPRIRVHGEATLWVMDAIDWGVAQRVGERIAGSPPSGGVRAATVQPRAYEFARRVGDYSGLQAPAELPPLEAVDRPAWIAANLRTMRPMMACPASWMAVSRNSSSLLLSPKAA